MVTRLAPDATGERLFLVVNAACKTADFAHLRAKLPDLRLEMLEDRALLALQGPAAAAVLERHLPGVAALAFMSQGVFVWRGAALFVSRSGYTGEDGFEISVPADAADALRRRAAAGGGGRAIGLGARDSLRLEAGLCLYGHEIDATTSPIEAALELVDFQAPARGRRLSRRGAHQAGIGRGHVARAGRPCARRQGAGARGRRNRQCRRRCDRARDLGRLCAFARPAHRHGLCAARSSLWSERS